MAFPDADFRHDIIVRDDGNGAYIAEWNLPDAQPSQAELNTAWKEWIAEEPQRAARQLEIQQAHPIAYEYFASHPAVVAFIRKTPAEQEAEIEAMTLAQLRTVIKFLAVAVAALVKREFL